MKRRRSAAAQPTKKPSAKVDKDHDEEILSSSSSLDGGNENDRDEFFEQLSADSDGDSDPALSATPETAQEKRIRLAKDYLSEIGVSVGKHNDNTAPEPGAESADSAEEDEDEADEGERLRRERVVGDAMLLKGRGLTQMAQYSGFCSTARTEVRSVRGHKLSATCVAVSDLETIAVTGSKDRSIALWDTETGKRTGTLPGRKPTSSIQEGAKDGGHVGNVQSIAMSGDGAVIASGGLDRVVRIWDARVPPAAASIATLRGHRKSVNSVAFRKGTRQLFSASDDQTIKIWDAAEMSYVETLFGHGAEATCVDSLTRERALSGARDGTIRLWKIVEGSQLVFRSSAMCVDAVAMSTENSFVSGGDDGSISGWSVTKKKPTCVIPDAHGPNRWISALGSPRFSDIVASGASDGSLRFWKFGPGKKVGVLELERRSAVNIAGVVNGIAFGEVRRIAAVAVGDEHRLGRWFDKVKCRNGLAVVVLPTV